MPGLIALIDGLVRHTGVTPKLIEARFGFGFDIPAAAAI
jgi:hypothetical protein